MQIILIYLGDKMAFNNNILSSGSRNANSTTPLTSTSSPTITVNSTTLPVNLQLKTLLPPLCNNWILEPINYILKNTLVISNIYVDPNPKSFSAIVFIYKGHDTTNIIPLVTCKHLIKQYAASSMARVDFKTFTCCGRKHTPIKFCVSQTNNKECVNPNCEFVHLYDLYVSRNSNITHVPAIRHNTSSSACLLTVPPVLNTNVPAIRPNIVSSMCLPTVPPVLKTLTLEFIIGKQKQNVTLLEKENFPNRYVLPGTGIYSCSYHLQLVASNSVPTVFDKTKCKCHMHPNVIRCKHQVAGFTCTLDYCRNYHVPENLLDSVVTFERNNYFCEMDQPLCESFVSTGKCSDKNTCKNQHHINPPLFPPLVEECLTPLVSNAILRELLNKLTNPILSSIWDLDLTLVDYLTEGKVKYFANVLHLLKRNKDAGYPLDANHFLNTDLDEETWAKMVGLFLLLQKHSSCQQDKPLPLDINQAKLLKFNNFNINELEHLTFVQRSGLLLKFFQNVSNETCPCFKTHVVHSKLITSNDLTHMNISGCAFTASTKDKNSWCSKIHGLCISLCNKNDPRLIQPIEQIKQCKIDFKNEFDALQKCISEFRKTGGSHDRQRFEDITRVCRRKCIEIQGKQFELTFVKIFPIPDLITAPVVQYNTCSKISFVNELIQSEPMTYDISKSDAVVLFSRPPQPQLQPQPQPQPKPQPIISVKNETNVISRKHTGKKHTCIPTVVSKPYVVPVKVSPKNDDFTGTYVTINENTTVDAEDILFRFKIINVKSKRTNPIAIEMPVIEIPILSVIPTIIPTVIPIVPNNFIATKNSIVTRNPIATGTNKLEIVNFLTANYFAQEKLKESDVYLGPCWMRPNNISGIQCVF